MSKSNLKGVMTELLRLMAQINAIYEADTGEDLEAFEAFRDEVEIALEACDE